MTDGTSSHDWPVTNLATGRVSGLCWFCGDDGSKLARTMAHYVYDLWQAVKEEAAK